MEQIKRSWYVTKFYKNAAVADPLFKYTLPDYRFEWIDSYVNVIWFQSEQVPQSTEDGNVIVMEHSYNAYVEEEDQITDEGKEDGDSDSDDNEDIDDLGIM